MSTFTRSIRKVFLNAGKSFVNYPAVMVHALLFTIVLLVRTTMEWETQSSYAFFLNTLQLTFALGAIFSLAAITLAHRRGLSKNEFLAANLIGVLVPAIAFVLLYLFGGYVPDRGGFGVADKIITNLASGRMVAGIFISLLAFLLLAGEKEEGLDFQSSVFMTMKAFFIALLYGLVILIGVSGVFGAIRTLIYPDLSFKVFGYIASISGFIGFSIFIGYFPDFRKGVEDKHRKVAESQPRFITVLLEFILVPIMLALTVVLILWALLTMIGGMDTRFINLYSIATSFAFGGLLLHILITKNESSIAKFYKKVFPFAALFILLFEAWALVIQLNKFGLKTTEYLFIIVWVIAFASSILLILKKEKAHRWIVYITAALTVVCVLPIVGFTDLPFTQQTSRLETVLKEENMIQGGEVVPAKTLPSRENREKITESVEFLLYSTKTNYPSWFIPQKLNYERFENTLGFAQVYSGQDPDTQPEGASTTLTMLPGVMDVSDYQWSIPVMGFQENEGMGLTFKGKSGEYEIIWGQQTPSGIPILEIKLDGKTILKDDLTAYVKTTLDKYPLGSNQELTSDSKDLIYEVESDQVSVTLLFDHINIYKSGINDDIKEGEMNHFLSLVTMFLNEK